MRGRVQVRVSAGEDPSTGERITLVDSVMMEMPGNARSERAALKEAEKLRTKLLADADARHPQGMDGMWTLGVLPAGAKNMQPVAGGDEATTAAAFAAAGDAPVAATGRCGRQEHRLTLADMRVIIMPGLADEGVVDLGALRNSLQGIAPAAR
jgi:hypothetical protein